MAVGINTVYQTVLYVLNKEQRGYVTPAEFNRLAQLVQNEIFQSYFLCSIKTCFNTYLASTSMDCCFL